MTSTVTAKGKVTIPKHVRDVAGMNPGDRVIVRTTASGRIYVGPVPGSIVLNDIVYAEVATNPLPMRSRSRGADFGDYAALALPIGPLR